MNHNLLLLVYVIIGLTAFAGSFRVRESFGDRVFPILLVSIALSLLMSGALISDYVPHNDMLGELIVYMQVAQLGYWQSQVSVLYNSALSVTILPLIISKVSSIEASIVFKDIYPCLFAIVPLPLYKIYREIMSPGASFISVFVFLSSSTYFEMLSLGRQMIAELIMVLLLWVLLTAKFRKTRAGAIIVVLLTTGLVVSHYSLALIYVCLIGFSYVASRIFTKLSRAAVDTHLLTLSIVTAVAWFLLAAGGIVLHTAIGMSTVIVSSMTDFFSQASRPGELYTAVGLTTVNYGILHLANRGIQYLVVLCIIVGFVTYIIRKPNHSSGKEVIIPLMAAAMFLLIASVALPFFASTLKLSRIYSISLLFLSPCFYFGANAITTGVKRICSLLIRNRVRFKIGRLVPAAIMFSYLIFSSGWVWAVTSDTPTSLVLDFRHMANFSDANIRFEYYRYYIQSEDVVAGGWIRSYNSGGSVCADLQSQLTVVVLYGGETQGPDLAHRLACSQAKYTYVSVMNSVIGMATSPSGLFGIGSTALLGHESFYILPVNETTAPLLPNTENRIFSDGGTIYSPYSS